MLRANGKSKTREYNIWQLMKSRCQNPKNQDYAGYGGRGIVVCEAWQSFLQFLADMGECPAGYSIERDDVNGNYTPENCRWIPKQDQAKNRRNTPLIEFNSRKMLLTAWSLELGIPVMTLHHRLYARKWSVEKAFTTRPRTFSKAAKLIEHEGVTLNKKQWARRLGLSSQTFNFRVQQGWSMSRIVSTPAKRSGELTVQAKPA